MPGGNRKVEKLSVQVARREFRCFWALPCEMLCGGGDSIVVQLESKSHAACAKNRVMKSEVGA